MKDWTNSDFSGSNLPLVNFQKSILKDVSFRGARLQVHSFRDADLPDADFRARSYFGITSVGQPKQTHFSRMQDFKNLPSIRKIVLSFND